MVEYLMSDGLSLRSGRLPANRSGAVSRSVPGMGRFAHCLIVAMICMGFPGIITAADEMKGSPKESVAGIAGKPSQVTKVPRTLLVSLNDYVVSVMRNNEQIAFQDAEWAVTREAVRGAKAVFEPVMLGTYQLQYDKRKNTAQQMMSTFNNGGFVLPEFWEDSYSQQLAVEELLPVGGRVKLAYSYRDFSDSVNEGYGFDKYKQTTLGASISQPLLKDAGVAPTMAPIRIAEADRDIAFQNYRMQAMRVVAEAMSAYWDLFLAREKLSLRRDSARTAEKILHDNFVRLKTGKMAETEVIEAKAALAARRSLVSEAKQAVVAAMNMVRTFLSTSVALAGEEIETVDRPSIEVTHRDFAESLNRSFKLRGEYLAVRKKVEREDVRLAYAKNQLWPQIDLKGSYFLNGLTDRYADPFNDATKAKHPSWMVGLELKIPLGGNKKASSEHAAALQRRRQVLLEVKAVEVSLANSIETALRNVDNSLEQVKEQSGVVEMTRKLLDTETERFRIGKSNSRMLFEREQNLINAREGEAETLVKFMKALHQLDLAEGALLMNRGVEIKEVERQ